MKNRIAALSLTLALSVGLCVPAHAAETSFSDVPADHWAASSIARMEEAGVMTGVGNHQFAPEKTTTYAEFITMVVRQFYADKLGSGGDTWYSPSMSAAESVGILSDTNVSAEDVINRYEMAQIIYNVMNEQKMPTSSLPDTSKVADWSDIPSTYQDAVSVCYNMGMLSGVDGKGTFNGNGVMTRAQAAVVMDRLIGNPQVAPPAGDIPAGATLVPPDSPIISYIENGTIEGGTIKLSADGVFTTYPVIALKLDGKYTTLTYTVTAGSMDHSSGVNELDTILGECLNPDQVKQDLPAGETRTYVVNVTGIRAVEISVMSGRYCDAMVTNIYLT